MKDTVACERILAAQLSQVPKYLVRGINVLRALLAGSWLRLQAAAEAPPAAPDRLQLAIDYVFTGRLDATNGPEITDRRSYIVLVPSPSSIVMPDII